MHEAAGHDDAAPRTHLVRRVQATRWGLLLRVLLPNASGNSKASGSNELKLRFLSARRPLAVTAGFCMARVLRRLISAKQPGDLDAVGLVDEAIAIATAAAAQA